MKTQTDSPIDQMPASPKTGLLGNLQPVLYHLPFAIGFAALLGLCSSLFLYKLADRDLWSSHEGRAAQDAQSILDEGCWGLPHLFDRKSELQKPPLYYWLAAAVARCRGRPVDAWAVRLPACLAGFGGVLGLYLLGVWRGRRGMALMAAIMLATTIHYTWLARIGRIDMPLTLTIGVALGAFYLGQRRRQDEAGRGAWWFFLAAYLAVGVAVLLKGPIGLVLPAAVALVSLWLDGALPVRGRPKDWRRLAHSLGLWWGLPVLLALALPWFVWADLTTRGALFHTFIWHHNIERAFGGSSVLHELPAWFYIPRLTVDLLPWSVLLPAAGWYVFHFGLWRTDPEARFGLVWFGTMVAVLSCAQFKRADYLLPAYPGAALVLACAGEHWLRRTGRPRWLLAAFGVVVAGCCASWWIYVGRVLPKQELPQEDRRFAAAIRQLAPPPQPVIFFRTEAHALAFHVGKPLETILEWENLDWWATRPGPIYVIMPPDIADQWPQHLKKGRLEKVLSNSVLAGARHKHPLELWRSHARLEAPAR